LNQQSDESLSDTGFIDQHQDNKLAKTVPLMDFSKSLHGVSSNLIAVPLCLDKRTKPDYPWEQVGFWVNEGPSVIIRNGRVFISYSASATDHNYCIGLLTASESSNLLDPKSWNKARMPVFKSSADNDQYGPGHSSFTVSADGKTDLLFYHARGYRDIKGDPLRNPDRHTRVQRLGWKKDGTPDFGEPVPDGPLP
jgi:GH43 family beta-xylosidase